MPTVSIVSVADPEIDWEVGGIHDLRHLRPHTVATFFD